MGRPFGHPDKFHFLIMSWTRSISDLTKASKSGPGFIRLPNSSSSFGRFDLEQPAIAVCVFVDLFRFVFQVFIHFHHFAGSHGVYPAHPFAGFNGSERFALFDFLAFLVVTSTKRDFTGQFLGKVRGGPLPPGRLRYGPRSGSWSLIQVIGKGISFDLHGKSLLQKMICRYAYGSMYTGLSSVNKGFYV